VSGCPEWLRVGALKYIGLNKCVAIGSKQKMIMGFPITIDYCYSKNKVKMFQSENYDINC
jgi:hypothetical protein